MARPPAKFGRLVGCTTGTASKWRVRYARHRLAGLDETGKRGAQPNYGPEHGSFIASYNETARPFAWTKSVVHQKRLKPCFAVQ
jgi:hypothetical protein